MTTSNAYFSKSQFELVILVLNRIIPAGGNMPAAGDVAAVYVDEVVSESKELRRLFGDGLAQIQIAAQTSFGQEFAELSVDQRDTVLMRVEVGHSEFFDKLVWQTYNGYYTNPKILELLGLEARPPQPRGHRLEQGNLRLIENVKKRGIAYRKF